MTLTLLPLLIAALTSGLVGLPHCAAMCGGLVTAVPGGPLARAGWHGGRLATYAGLGAAAGSAGGILPGPGWGVTVVAGAMLVWFAARLAGLGPARLPTPRWLGRAGGQVRRLGPLAPVGFGLLSGLLPCGLVYAALALPLAAAAPLPGALLMVAFGLGTVPGLALAAGAVQRLARSRPWTRRALALGVLVAGGLALGVRQPVATAGEPPTCHEPAPQPPSIPTRRTR